MPTTVTDIILQGGLNQSVGEPHRQPSDMLLAVNVRQNKTGAIEKRPGNVRVGATSLASGATPAKILALGNDVCVAQTPVGTGSVFSYYAFQSYTPAGAALGGLPGGFTGHLAGGEALLTRKTIDVLQDNNPANHGPSSGGSMGLVASNLLMRPAVAYGAGFYVYVEVDASGNIILTIEDALTGASVLSRASAFGVSASYALPIIVGTTLIIVYRQGGGGGPSPNIGAFTYNLANLTAGYSGPTTLALNGNTNCLQFDVANNGANFSLVFYNTSLNFELHTFTSALAPVGSANSITAPTAVVGLSMAIGSGLMAVSYHRSTVSSEVGVFAANASTLLSVLASQAVFTTTGGYPQNSGVAVLDASHVAVLGQLQDSAGWTYVTGATVTTGGAITNTPSKTYRASLLSKPFVNNGLTYAWVQQIPQNTAGATSTTDNIGKTNILVEFCSVSVNLAAVVPAATRPVASSCNRFAGASQYNWQGPSALTGAFPQSVVSPSAGLYEAVLPFLESPNTGFFARSRADLTSPYRWSPSTLGGLLTMNSGPMVYDHALLSETGFHSIAGQAPAISVAGAGGSLSAGTYYWSYCYRYQDASGNVHRSQPSIPTFFAGVTAGQIATLVIPALQLTCRSPQFSPSTVKSNHIVYVEIYRSQANPAVANGVTIPMNLTSSLSTSSGASTVSILDGVLTGQSDTNILSNAFLYTGGGTLPNVAPPSFKAICSHKSRIFGIADDGATIYFSKQYVSGEAVNFCDGMTLQIDDVVNLTALASMDSNLIIFSDQGIYYLIGNGPGDNGQNSDYDIPQRIASDVGCVNSNSVVVTPAGVLFESPTGIYLLDRGFNVTWLGQPIADELTFTTIITSATLHPYNPWVYFTLNTASYGSGTERLIYDYRIDKWYTDNFANSGTAVSITHQARTAGAIYFYDNQAYLWQEDASGTVFTDNGVWVTMDFEVGWSHPTSLQGYQTTRQALLLGQKLSDYDLLIESRGGYSSTYDATQMFFDTNNASQARSPTQQFSLAIEKEQQAVTVRVTDFAPSGGSAIGTGAGARFYGITYEYDPLDGTFRLDPAQQGG